MPLVMTLQRSATRPNIAEELATKIKAHVVEGRYRANDTLPTVARLAADFGISESTAIAAYIILKREKVTVSSTRGGTRIAAEAPTAAMLEEYVQTIISAAVEECRAASVPQEIVECVSDRAVGEWYPARGNRAAAAAITLREA